MEKYLKVRDFLGYFKKHYFFKKTAVATFAAAFQ